MEQLVEEITVLSDDDVVVLKPHQPVMFQKCCNCGLVHRVEVSPRSEDIRFRHVNIGYEFPPDLVPELYLERGAAGG